MKNVPNKIALRIADGIKNFQGIVLSAKSRDVNESDTVTIVTDMLNDIFGYDKYSDVTSEHAIRGTYCDLAVKVDGTLTMLIEVKAIGLDLKDQYVKQAVDYAANEGIEWVILTNAAIWKIYHIAFCKPIEHELVLEFVFTELTPKSRTDIDKLWLLAKEGWKKTCLDDYHERCQVLSRYTLAAILLSEQSINLVRREVKRIAPGIKVEVDQISTILREEVIKRDALGGEKAAAARRSIAKRAKRPSKKPVEPKPQSDMG